MLNAPHRIALLHFTASVPDLDLAFGLRARIERLAWEMLPAAIERVFDAVGPPDQLLRIARLDLDLGTVRPDHLEEDALDALRRALTDALGQALHDARYSPSDAARLIDPAAMLVADFDRYLRSGRLPVARRDAGFDAAARLQWLIVEQPEALIAMLRRRARDRHALERLVLQAGEAGFAALIALLAPRDAAVILALLADVVLVQRDPPTPIPAALSAPALDRVLRVATLEFLLRDPGSQFNRRRFLSHLIAREARAMGVDYAVLLRLLGDAVTALRVHQGLRSSLPRILSELLDEPAALGAREPPVGDASLAAAIAAARAGAFDALLAWVRRVAGDRTALDALVARLSGDVFDGLIERLDPANAALILAMLDDLVLVQHADPEVQLDDFELSLRALTLAYLVRDPGTQFNRRQFLAFLIAREAERARVSYRDLVQLFAAALARLRSHQGLRASLPAVLAELLDGLDADGVAPMPDDPAALLTVLQARAQDPAALVVVLRQLTPELFARLLRRLRPASAGTIAQLVADLIALPLPPATRAEWSAWVRAAAIGWLLRAPQRRFDRRVWLDAVIAELAGRGGEDAAALRRRLSAADWRTDADALAALVRQIKAGGADAAVLAAIRQRARDPAMLRDLAGRIDPSERERLLALLDPVAASAISRALLRYAARHAATPLLDLRAAEFDALLWALAVNWRAGAGPGAFDAAAFDRFIVRALVRFGGGPEAEIAAALMPEASRPVAHDAQRLIDQYLRGGTPQAAGRGLAAMYAAEPQWLAMAIRRHARSAPAHVSAMIERLFEWLTPDEVIDCLEPGMGRAARRWADAMGGVDAAQWQAIVATMLAGETPDFAARASAAGRRLDRVALIAHWLSHDALPWWSPDRDALTAALAALPQLSFVELERLFGDGERGFACLWRVVETADPALQAALFERLIPWATRPRGGVAAVLDRLGTRERLITLTRAAADALSGVEPDLTRLASPQAPPAWVPSAPSAVIATTDAIDTARLFSWLDGASANPAEQEALQRHFAMLADRDDAELQAWLDQRRGDARARARWAMLLPVEGLARLVRLLVPGGAQLWLDSAAIVLAAARRSATFGAPAPDPAQLWTMLLDLVAARDVPTPVAGAALLVERLAAGDGARAERLRTAAVRIAQDGGHRVVAAAMRRAAPPDPSVAAPPRGRTVTHPDPEAKDPPIMPDEDDDAIFIGNAGLVLFAPFLPTLFERLGVLADTEKGPRIVDPDAMSRAVHLLQYLVDARLDAPEPELVLNKLLCGLPSATPVAAAIEPSESDLAMCDGLIGAVIGNWTILGNASPAALRETFLQREGRLTHGADRWNLVVQRKSVDVLVDQLPWSIAMIFHRWMSEPVHTTW